MIKNIIAGFLAGLIASVGVIGIKTIITDEVVIEDAIQGIQGEKGERGVRGYTGAKGDAGIGIQGIQGLRGYNGTSVTVDQVLTALDEREDVVEIDISLSDTGVGTSTVITLEEGIYEVSIFHAGSEYFGASLNGHGRNVVFASQDGYVSSEEDIEITDEGEYTINITTLGTWTFDIISK